MSYNKSKTQYKSSERSRYKPYHDRSSSSLASNTCYRCGKSGHFKKDCPNLKNKLSNTSNSDFGIKKGQQGYSLKKIDWKSIKLNDFKKDFLTEIKNDLLNATKNIDINKWRDESSISVLSGYHQILTNDKKRIGYDSFYNNSWNYNGNDYNNGYNNDDIDNNSKAPEIPNPILGFGIAKFPNFVMKNIENAGFTKPTPIQSQAWPMAFTGCDVIGIAQTGSGKTLAFLLPAIKQILSQKPLSNNDGPIALIIAPTRELAVQIEGECKKFCASKYGEKKINYCCVYGGAPRFQQMMKLKKGCEIVIATPGRLLDFIENEITNLKRVTYLVIDEADRLLDMGFEPQLLAIANQIRPDRQMMMFSATWPKAVINLAKKFLTKSNNIFQIIIGSKDLTCNNNVTQNVCVLENKSEKLTKLKELIDNCIKQNGEHSTKIIIFAGMKKSVDYLQQLLWDDGYYIIGIHGDKAQPVRDKAIQKFKNNEMNILIATDVASRGLHIDDVNMVINYDFPQQIEDYVHRIGRTGRVDKKGESWSFLTEDDAPRAKELIKVLKDNNQEIPSELQMMSKLRNAQKRQRNGFRNGRNGYGNRNRGGRRW